MPQQAREQLNLRRSTSELRELAVGHLAVPQIQRQLHLGRAQFDGGVGYCIRSVRLAKEKLGIETINRGEVGGDVQNKLMELVPGGVDVAGYRFATTLLHKVERAVGLETDTADILNECMYCLKKWGRLSIIGDYAGFCNQFAIGAVQLKHLTVRSGQCPCQRYFEEVMEHVRSGEMDPTFMITHRISLEEVPEAYHKLFYKEDGYVKVFIPMT